MATKTKDYKVTITDQQNEYTFSAKSKNAIYVKGIKQDDIDTDSFKIVGNNLLFSAKGKDFVVSNYTGIKYIKTDNASGKTDLLDIISHSYVDNTDNEIKNLVKPYYNSKKLSVSGTNYNDVIDLSESGYQPTGSKNIRNNKGITINGGNGDDEITGTIYNDNITGAAGANVINYSKGFGHDVVNLAKGENLTLKFDNTLSLDDLKFEYTNKNKDLKISYNNNEGSITLKNFASKNVTNNANAKKNLADSSSVELIIDNITYDLRSNQKDGEYWYEIKPTGNFTGGWLNDHINAKNADEIKNRKNNHVDLVLKGGAGDDLIESSMTADKITGGAGHNIIKYTSLEQLKGDKVYLTKGEKLDIDISEMASATATYRVTKNDLVVTVEYNEQKEDFTIINFGTKDVTNNKTKKIDDTSNVKLITATEPDGIDLRQDIEVSTNTGTYHNDNIDRSDYDVWEDRKKTVRSTNWNKTGLTIKGGAGDDTITGTDYSDKIYGNTGSDIINAGTGNNYIYFNKGDGNDIIENGNGIDTLVFAKKTQLSYSYDKYDLIIKYSDKDTVTLKDYLKGHSVKFVQIGKNRTLFNPQKPQFNEYNEDGYHVIEGTAIEDTIVGTNNNDKIFGNDGDDNIDAKKGADIIDGGVGNNTYTFVSGDGQDTIINGDGNDTIEFPDTQNITYSKALDSNDLIIGYGDSDSITLRDYFVNNSHSTKTILNGTTELNISEEVAKGYNLLGTESAETFDGTTDIPFTYVVNGGNDIIQNSKNTDTIKINTQETLNYSKESNSNDLVITYGDNSITVKDYFDTENHVEKIVNKTNILNIANELDNKLEILIPNNETSITGTTNNDVIHLKNSGITFFVSEGDGNDIVYSGTDEDTLVINNKTFDDISYKKENNDLVISYSTNDSVTLKNYFTEEHSVKNITAGDDTELLADKIKLYFNGTNNSETITGTDYDDVITSNKGNDTIDGGKKNNTYIFISGDGKDTIVNGQGNDSIKFNTNLDLRFSHNLQNNDLVIAYSNSDTITLQDYYVNNSHSVKTIQNGTEILTVEEALNIYGIDITGTSNSENITGTSANDTIIGGRGADIINGGSGNNTYVFNTGDGADTIINGAGVDTIKFNITQTLTYTHDLANDDLVIGYGNSDSIILKDYFKANSHSIGTIINNTRSLDLISELAQGMTIIGTSSAESIDGTVGDDIISSNGGADIITGGKGIDKLYGGSGNSTYIFSIGNGKDEIYSGTGQDTIVINNVTFDDLIYEKSNNDLIINYSNEDSITLKNYFITTHSVKNITVAGDTELLAGKIKLSFNGTDSSETITGTDYDDTITANQGNDTINGGLGNNLYVFNQNDGRDTIIKGNGTDTIKFNQTGNIRFSRDFSNNDLVLKYGNNDTITLQNYYVNNSHSVKTIINGTETLTLEEALNAYGIDITGTSGNNNITGTSANDTINAEQGTDTIDGGNGNNTYLFMSGDGADTIINGAGVDTIKFNTAQTLTYTKDIPNNNLIISYGNNDTITLQNYFVGDNHSVKTIQNGTQTLTIADEILKGMTFIGSSSADTINGTDYSDVIRSIAGNDTITANKGNDELYSGSGNSTYVFNLGDGADNIYSGSGEDTIEINGVTFDNLSYTKDNNNLIINYSNSDSIKLIDFFSSTHSVKNIKIGDTIDLLDNRIKDLVINGTNNAETVNGTKYDDIITPNGGNDTINGGLGNNTYVFKIGDGTNSIVKGTGTDKVVLPNNSTIKLSRSMSNQDLTINYGTNSNVVLKDYFVNSNHSVKSIVINDTEKTLANFIAENGIEYTGTNSGETINGSSGNDTINGGKGNDTLNGNAGNDLYVFVSGDGTDTINATVGEDTIWFKTQVSNISYARSSNNQDLILTYGNNDSITIKGYFTGTSSIRNIKNGNTVSTIENSVVQFGLNIMGTDSNDNITGTNNKDIIDGRKGSDTIHGGLGDDTIYGGSNDTGTVYGVPGNDTIYGEDGNDYIETSKGYTYQDVFGETQTLYSNNYVDGGSGDDTIVCYNGNNTVVGGTGNDKITVGIGTNTLNFVSGDGNDTIYGGTKSDIIKISDYELDNLKYEKSGNNLIIKYGNNYSDSITLDKFFSTTNNNRNLIGKNNTNSTIQDKAQIYTTASIGGTYLNDIYTITASDLTPTITSSGGSDTLYFENTNFNDLEYRISGDDFYIGFNKIDGTVRNWAILKNWMTDTNHSVKYIKTSDRTVLINTVMTLEQNYTEEGDSIYGTRLNDVITFNRNLYKKNIYCGEGNDNITVDLTNTYNSVGGAGLYGEDGDDTINITRGCYSSAPSYGEVQTLSIYGGKGNDVITVSDTMESSKLEYLKREIRFAFNDGDGNDTISGICVDDSLRFKDINELTFSKSGNNLVISYGINDSVTLKNYFVGTWKDRHAMDIYDSNGYRRGIYQLFNFNGGRINTQTEYDDYFFEHGDTLGTHVYFKSFIAKYKERNGNDTYYKPYNTSENIYIGQIIDGEGNYDEDYDKKLIYEKENNDLLIRYNFIDSVAQDSLRIVGYWGMSAEYNRRPIINAYTNSNFDYKVCTIKQVNMYGKTNKANTLTGTEYNDYIYGANKNDTLNGKAGNNELYGKEGNDTYIVEDLSASNIIYDLSGTADKLTISDKTDMVLRFDMQIDAQGNIIYEKNMYITKVADFGKTNKGITVTDQFVDGHSIETINSAYGEFLTTTQINQLRSDIAAWLHDNGFESVQEIIDSKNQTNINNLIAEFQKANWQEA